MRDFTTVQKALEGVDVVLHLAAETGTGQSMYMINQYNEVNVMGLSNIFQALSLKGKATLYAKSSCRHRVLCMAKASINAQTVA